MFCLIFLLNFVVADHHIPYVHVIGNALRGLSNDENSCSDGGCQNMQGTSDVSCSGGNCTLSECTKDCSCSGGNCSMPKCTENCTCDGGNCTDMGPCKSGCTCSGGQRNMSKATANASCSGGDCDMSSVTTNADCSGGNCKMPKCSKDCQCGGGCNMASCASGCSCVYKLCADGPIDLKPEQLCTMTKCDEAANICIDSDKFLSGCWGHAGVGCKDIVKSAPNGKAGSSECAALGSNLIIFS